MKKEKERLKNEVSKGVLKYPVFHDEQDDLLKKMVSYHEVIALIDQLDEPEKPVIPDFMAYWIEDNEYLTLMYIGFELFSNRIKDADVNDWISNNQEKFCRAFLAWPNVAVEKEKKYRIIFPHTSGYNEKMTLMTNGGSYYIDEVTDPDFEVAELTEQEIKTIDERYWAFAEEVTQ